MALLTWRWSTLISEGSARRAVAGLRRELSRRVTAGQRVRAPLAGGKPAKKTIASMLSVDADKRTWLKGVISRRGFPTPAMVGNRGVPDYQGDAVCELPPSADFAVLKKR